MQLGKDRADGGAAAPTPVSPTAAAAPYGNMVRCPNECIPPVKLILSFSLCMVCLRQRATVNTASEAMRVSLVKVPPLQVQQDRALRACLSLAALHLAWASTLVPSNLAPTLTLSPVLNPDSLNGERLILTTIRTTGEVSLLFEYGFTCVLSLFITGYYGQQAAGAQQPGADSQMQGPA